MANLDFMELSSDFTAVMCPSQAEMLSWRPVRPQRMLSLSDRVLAGMVSLVQGGSSRMGMDSNSFLKTSISLFKI